MAQKELVEKSSICKEITWNISHYIPQYWANKVESLAFSFANGTWNLIMYRKGRKMFGSKLFIDFAICRLQSLEEEQRVNCKIFLKTSRGEKFATFRHCLNFTSKMNRAEICELVPLSKLVETQKSLAPQDVLTVVIRMQMENVGTLEGVTKGCNRKIEICTQTEEDFGFENKQLKPAIPGNKFVCDIKRLLLNEDGCDVTLQVKGQTFQAHRTILRARSPVFASMLNHDMVEKNTGLIDIVDCDPEHFPDFLGFLYSGSAEIITSQNACSLYRSADKYDVQDLKSECLAFVKSHLDVDNFCDVIILALQHGETDLIKQCTDFFVKNALKIVVTVKWQVFLTDNPIQGNELTIKALSANKSSNA